MYTHELWDMGEKYVPNFVGVFPLDELPVDLKAPSNLIVNTHTKNLDGEHWLALSYQKGGIVFAFDPLGLYYPYLLQKYLSRLGARRIHYNKIPYQRFFEDTCGIYCIAWLIYITKWWR